MGKPKAFDLCRRGALYRKVCVQLFVVWCLLLPEHIFYFSKVITFMQLCFLIGWNDKSISDRPWPVSRTFFKLYTYEHNVFFWLPFDCELTHWCMYTEPSRWSPCFWTPTGTDIFCICWRTRNNRPRPTWPSSSSTTTNMEGRTDPCKTKNINSHCARERKGILGQNLEILHVRKSKLCF